MVRCSTSSITQSLSYSRFHNFLLPFGNFASNSYPLFSFNLVNFFLSCSSINNSHYDEEVSYATFGDIVIWKLRVISTNLKVDSQSDSL